VDYEAFHKSNSTLVTKSELQETINFQKGMLQKMKEIAEIQSEFSGLLKLIEEVANAQNLKDKTQFLKTVNHLHSQAVLVSQSIHNCK
jgi:uncharacterized protein (AIM24 family)